MDRIRVATYNVHKCQGMDRRTSPARIAEVIRETAADIVGLQEVLSVENDSPELNQSQFIADQLGMSRTMGDVRMLRGGLYGNVILSRLPVRSHCKFDLSVQGREPRGCIRTDVDIGASRPLHLFNFHLGTAFLERRRQARLIFESNIVCGPDISGPRVVLGDFNEWTRGLVSRVLASEFRGADIRLHLRGRRSYPGVLPFLHLDHIYYDEDLILEHVALHRSRRALVASDHLPLIADFALRNGS